MEKKLFLVEGKLQISIADATNNLQSILLLSDCDETISKVWQGLRREDSEDFNWYDKSLFYWDKGN